jgi:hypothetical protein
MSNALHWRESIRAQGKVFSNYGDGKLPPVSFRLAMEGVINDPCGSTNQRENVSRVYFASSSTKA